MCAGEATARLELPNPTFFNFSSSTVLPSSSRFSAKQWQRTAAEATLRTSPNPSVPFRPVSRNWDQTPLRPRYADSASENYRGRVPFGSCRLCTGSTNDCGSSLPSRMEEERLVSVSWKRHCECTWLSSQICSSPARLTVHSTRTGQRRDYVYRLLRCERADATLMLSRRGPSIDLCRRAKHVAI
jgi:hypothetical protein